MKNSIVLPSLALLAILAGVTWSASPASADGVPNPTLIGPIPQNAPPGDPSHDYTFFTPIEDLADYGYMQEEYFIEGTANRYDTPDGETGTIISSGHPYKTRIVVRRPIDANKSNGVVLFEWQNVSAGYEIDAHWGASWPHFVKYGYTWVGVTAQAVGIHSAPFYSENNALRAWSPTRYGDLDLRAGNTVFDDSLCYDVFAQAAQAVLNPTDGVDPMGGIPVELALAVGASQSAGRLAIYHNSIHPLHQLFDGLYLLVGGGDLRTDSDLKTMQYLSETDLRSGPGRRQDDSDVFRGWEVAGTGHSSQVSNVYREPITLRDFGSLPFPPDCDLPPFSHVPGYYVINKQYDLLVDWVENGTPPPTAPKLEFFSEDPPVFARDELGIVLGGIRLPAVDVPIALNTGINSGSVFCSLYGTNQPFDDETLNELYSSHGDYVSGVAGSATANRNAGYIHQDAVTEMIEEAAHADVPPM
jgi:hypothetical protein